MSEALIFASTNPQYDDRLFIELQVQYYVHENSSKLKPGENMLWTQIVSDIQNNFCTQHVLPMFWTWNFHVLNLSFNEQYVVILWVSWCKNKSFWQRFTCILFHSGFSFNCNCISMMSTWECRAIIVYISDVISCFCGDFILNRKCVHKYLPYI